MRNFKSKICPACNVEFSPTGPKQKWCDNCRARENRKRDYETFKRAINLAPEKLPYRAGLAKKHREKMGALGFVQRTFFVHADDANLLSEFAALLKSRRIDNPGNLDSPDDLPATVRPVKK